MYYIYILRSKNGKYYTGCASDLNKRLEQHNQKLVRSTKKYTPWQLIYTEEYATLKNARKREKQIKSWKKRNAIEKLINSLS